MFLRTLWDWVASCFPSFGSLSIFYHLTMKNWKVRYFFTFGPRDWFCDAAMRPDFSPWTLVPLTLSYIMFEIMMYLIFGYLRSKPLGMQSLMDVVNKILLTNGRFFAFIVFVVIMCTQIFSDTGHIIAVLTSWPIYYLGGCVTLSMTLNAILQYKLTTEPSLLLGFKKLPDSTTKLIMGMTISAIMLIIILILMIAGIRSPAYYVLRSQKGSHLIYPKAIQLSQCIVCLVTVISIRLKLWNLKRQNPGTRSTKTKSSHLMSNQVLAIMASIFSLYYILPLTTDVTMGYISMSLIWTFPAAVVLSNEKIRKFSWRKLSNLKNWCIWNDFIFLITDKLIWRHKMYVKVMVQPCSPLETSWTRVDDL